MDTSIEKTYSLLQSIFSLNTLLTSQVSQSIQLGNKSITYVPHEENSYFYLGAFIEEDRKDDVDNYNEVIVRIWKNNTAEVYSLRQVHFGGYEETYSRKNGIETAKPLVWLEANEFFTNWLINLQNEHGSLQLQ